MRTLLLGIFVFLSGAFLQAQENNTGEAKKKKTTEKKKCFLKRKKEMSVVIAVTKTSSYCGGARPTKEMEERLNTPSAFAGKKIFLKKGEKNGFSIPVVIEAITDTSGKISVKLPAGKYLIVDEEKKDSACYNSLVKKYSQKTEFYSAINVECLKDWFEKPDLVIEVKAGGKNEFTINYHTPCAWRKIPCTQYSGPLPP